MTQEPKISLVFDRKKRATTSNAAAVELRVYYDRQRVYFSTGVMLYDGQWLHEKVVNRYDAAQLNAQIYEQLTELNAYIYNYIGENGDFQLSVLTQYKEEQAAKAKAEEEEASKDPFTWMKERLEKRTLTVGTRGNHLRTIENLRRSGLFRTWDDFTTPNIMRWNDKLKKQVSKQSSLHGYHKRLKVYIREALTFGLLTSDPYAGVHIDRGHSEDIKYITKEERARIEALELQGGEEKARDLFIFACYTGLSFSDLQKIKKSDVKGSKGHKYIEDKRCKTGTRYHIVLLPKALAILEKYDYNLNIITNQKANWYLKCVQALAQIDTNLTMHVGRHTFATWALSEGIPIEIVSKMLAHSNIAVTQVYAKVLPTKVEQAFATLQAAD